MQVIKKQFFKICTGGMAGTAAALGFAHGVELTETRQYKLQRAADTFICSRGPDCGYHGAYLRRPVGKRHHHRYGGGMGVTSAWAKKHHPRGYREIRKTTEKETE